VHSELATANKTVSDFRDVSVNLSPCDAEPGVPSRVIVYELAVMLAGMGPHPGRTEDLALPVHGRAATAQ
jgi:hypothetical protein